MVFALAAWSVALDALTRGPRAAGPPGGGWRRGALGRPGWRALLAGLARAQSWLLLPLAAGYGIVAWRRGERRAALLVLPLAAPLVWLAHDWLLTGDPLYGSGPGPLHRPRLRPPGRPPGDWLALVARRYAADPLLLALAAVGVIWLVRRRAWVWLAALGAAGVGVLALLGLQAWQGTYILALLRPRRRRPPPRRRPRRRRRRRLGRRPPAWSDRHGRRGGRRRRPGRAAVRGGPERGAVAGAVVLVGGLLAAGPR